MIAGQEWVLVGAVATVGVLHTVVPDHWVPITIIARQQGWTKREVARAAFVAGAGHTVSTLLIGLVVWIAGVAFATKFGNLVSLVSSIALIAFGSWIAFSSLRELYTSHGHAHSHGQLHRYRRGANGNDRADCAENAPSEHEQEHEFDDEARDAMYVPNSAGTAVLTKHAHAHHHGRSSVHIHLHDHGPDTWHRVGAETANDPPIHEHRHERSGRTNLLLILGSSPMVEGIPAFFAAGKYGAGLIAVMAVVFAGATIVTYVGLCLASVAGLEQVKFGSLERYGEVLSGAFIACIGLVFLIFPIL